MNRKVILVLVLFLTTLTSSQSSTVSQIVNLRNFQVRSTPAAEPAEITVPFELIARHIVLPVRVDNSRPLSFIFDTGDKLGIIDLDRARELGLGLGRDVKIGGAGSGQLAGALVRGSSWTLPGLNGFSQPISLALPFNDLAAKLGHDFDGIIGSDFIKQFVVEVDYPARVIKLHDKERFSYSGPGESIPLQFNSQGHPLIDAEVTPLGSAPIKGKFVIDLGSGGALAFYSPFVRAHGLLRSGLKTIRLIGASGAGGQTSGQIGRVSQLNIGKFRFDRPITIFSEDRAGAFAGSELAGNIGQQIMSRFRIFLDYGHAQIILEANQSFTEPFDRAYAGLAIKAEKKDYQTFRVTEILENSPAFEAGMQKDDIITRIDDHPSTQLTLTRLNELFEQPQTYKVTLRRGDQTLQVSLTPKKLI